MVLAQKFIGFFIIFLLFTSHVFGLESGWEKTSLSSLYVSSVKTTPFGILAGENDGRLWLNPHNGVYISKNLGDSWYELGLSGRGVTDIEYSENKVWAATYYFVDGTNGIFVSEDQGSTWVHKGHNYSFANLEVSNKVVLGGTYSHGLWLSKDFGDTWEQKFEGTQIIGLRALENTFIAAVTGSTYISHDKGDTWAKIPDLEGMNFRHFEINGNSILATSADSKGLWISQDGGYSWNKSETWGDKSSEAVKYYWFNDTYYIAGKISESGQQYDVYSSSNSFDTFTSTNLITLYSENKVKSIDFVFSSPSYLFAAVHFDGVYKYSIPHTKIAAEPFMSPPWEVSDYDELTDSITAYFDHAFPLNGYLHYQEPEQESATTVNFLGISQPKPYIYYSSHEGTDFGLQLFAPIKAVADGTAQYFYSQTGLGHHIKVTHSNGYQSIYGHLDSRKLATTSTKSVIEGEMLGQVGMSGNTSGPHLHFEVLKDTDSDNEFADELPAGRVDPFGWQSMWYKDPWEGYRWIDSQGEHIGPVSFYNWSISPSQGAVYISPEVKELQLKNKRIIVEENSTENNFTIFLEKYPQPHFPIEQNKLTYVTGTSFVINAYNNLGMKLPYFMHPVKIEIDFSNANLENIDENSLNIYYWNQNTQIWEKIPSILDLSIKKVTGYTTHFSQFALLGEKVDSLAPVTEIKMTGNKNLEGHYTEYPEIQFSTNEPGTKTYFTLDQGKTWKIYDSTFVLDSEGNIILMYKSIDSTGNWESSNVAEFIILEQPKMPQNAIIKNSQFIFKL